MKKINYSILVMLFLISCSTTEYVSFLETNRKAEKLYENGAYCEAKKTLLHFYKKNKLPDGYFDLATSIYLCDSANRKDSYTYFELDVRKNGTPLKFYKQLETDTLFSSQLTQDNQWQQLIANYQTFYQEYENSLNLPLKKTIDSLFIKDQKVRNNIDAYDSFEKFETDVFKTDSSNLFLLKEIIKQQGLPNRYKIGRSSSDFMMMIYHTLSPSFNKNYKEWNYYFSKIKKDIKQNGGYGGVYMLLFFIDESYLGSNSYKGLQLYGTWYDRTTKEIFPIIDIKNVDKRRKKMGQESLYEFAKVNSLILPKNYFYKSK